MCPATLVNVEKLRATALGVRSKPRAHELKFYFDVCSYILKGFGTHNYGMLLSGAISSPSCQHLTGLQCMKYCASSVYYRQQCLVTMVSHWQ